MRNFQNKILPWIISIALPAMFLLILKAATLPPWSRTWWACLIYAGIGVCLVYLFRMYRNRLAELKNELHLAELDMEKKKAEWEREKMEREKAEAEYRREKAGWASERMIQEKKKSKPGFQVNDRQSLPEVDDQEQIRRYTAQIFTNKLTVYEATGGGEELQMEKQFTPDRIISDERMEGMDMLKIPVGYKDFLDKCIAMVERHLDDKDFSIQTMASEMGMSYSSLYKKLKTVSGRSVNAFIRLIRLRKAAELMVHTHSNVNQIAFRVGINDVKYFREQFGKHYGVKPSEYIKKYRKVY